MGLEKEGGRVGHGHAEVVSVHTSDEEVMHKLLTTIGEIPCRSGQFGVFLIQVHQNTPSVLGLQANLKETSAVKIACRVEATRIKSCS